MSTTAGRVFTGLTRMALCRGIFIHNRTTTVRLNGVRSIALSSQMLARSKRPADEPVNDEPIKFTTSKASHRIWKVEQSMGSHYQRPLWKVLPVSLFIGSCLLWFALRDETDIDNQLKKNLYERLPGLLPDEEDQNKSN